MADLRIQYTEPMVGYGHPTLSDTLNRLTAVEHNSDGTHKLPPKGFIQGEGGIAWSAANQITVPAMVADIEGELFELTSAVTMSIPVGTASTVYFVKATKPASGNALGASDFSVGAVPPTWSTAYAYWQIGSSSVRAIGWYNTDSAGNVAQFFAKNGLWLAGDQQPELLNTAAPSTTLTNLATITPPGIIVPVWLRVFASSVSGDGSAGIVLGDYDAATGNPYGCDAINYWRFGVGPFASNGNIKYAASQATLTEIYLEAAGIPVAMLGH